MKKIKFKLPKLPTLMFMGIDIVKNFIFFTIFIILSLIFLGVMAAPAIKYFKAKKYQSIELKQTYNQKQEKYNQILKEHNLLQIHEARTILSFNREFDKKSFENFAKKYINIIDIKNMNIAVYKKNFIKKSYKVTAMIKSPKNLYDFLNNLDKYKNILKIKLPITIENNSTKLEIKFTLEHYKVK